jgi:hypothetical protein
VSYRLGAAALVTATFVDAAGARLGTLFSEPKQPGEQSFRFSAAEIPDGRYRIVLVVQTAAGGQATASVSVVVSRLLRSFAVAPSLFSPNGDGRFDRALVTFALTSRARVTLRVTRGTTIAALPFSAELDRGSHRFSWDGRDGGVRVPDGRYSVAVGVGEPGVTTDTVLLTAPVTIDTTPPRIRVVSLRPLRFWLSERANVVIEVGGKRAAQLLGAGVSTFSYRGAVRGLRAYARDLAGNESRLVRVP